VKKNCNRPGRHKLSMFSTDPRTRIFSALACDHRIEILKLLRSGEKSTFDIAPQLNVDISVVSRHLAVLRNAGIINYRKEGLQNYYSIADQRIFDLLDICKDILKDMADKQRERYSVL